MSPVRLPRTDRERLLLVLVLVVTVTVFTATVPLLRGWFDLRVYYGTVDTWVHHGGRIYDYRVPGTTYGFTYPPFAAVSMLPMALLGLRAAITAALLLNLAALGAVVWMTAGPVLRPYGWYGWALTGCVLALFEPVRDTVSFGQVNLVLLALVLTDAWLLTTGRTRWAGIGIGLAAAIKLTPALFIGLLLLAGRRRAAGVATAVAAAATALAVWVAPDASRFYWSDALWDTERIGKAAYVSNQSLQGVLARLAAPGEPSRAVWLVLVVVVLAVWTWRARRAVAVGDWWAAFALTGLTACLVSPITWVHHLVWLLPSFAVLLRTGHARVAGAVYAVLCTSVVWLWFDDASGVDGFVGGSAYVWVTLGLLLWLPVDDAVQTRFGTTIRNTSDTAPAPTTAAPRIVQVSGQPGPLSDATVAGTGTGTGTDASGPACATGRAATSEPTGVTRPAAPKPQSSSERASS
ncbi:glycosyltransferase 87 family protein [Streptomyces sp. QTS52]